jgi:hypothetical protein
MTNGMLWTLTDWLGSQHSRHALERGNPQTRVPPYRKVPKTEWFEGLSTSARLWCRVYGEVAEWPKAPDCHSGAPLGRGATGSNPVLSANIKGTRTMLKIESYLSFVKEQAAVQEKLSKKYDEDLYRSGLHQKTRKNLLDLADFLEEIKSKGTRETSYLNRGNTPQKRILLTYEEIEDAPEELLRELNLSDADRQDLLMEYIIAQEGGVTSLDRILMELYRRTKEIPKRNVVTQRLYRMASRGMIYNVPGKKGVYSTYELSEDDAKKMFGANDESDEPSAPPSPPTAAPPPTPPSANTAVRKRSLISTALSSGPISQPNETTSGVQSLSYRHQPPPHR